MSFQPTLTTLLNGGSGLLLIAVAWFVYRAAAKERANLAFALFSGAWGLRQMLIYTGLSFTPGDPGALPFIIVGSIADLPYVAGLLLMAVWFPRPLTRECQGLLVVPLAASVAVGLAGLWASTLPQVQADQASRFGSALASTIGTTNLALIQSGFLLVLLTLAARFGRSGGPTTMRERSQVAILTAGLVAYSGMVAGASAIGAPWPEVRLVGLLALATHGLLALRWLRNAATAEGPDRRTARNLAWLSLLAPVVGLVAALPLAGTVLYNTGPQYGVARVLVVLVVAYGIVRYQLMGIDVKVRWTIKQSTVAAAFVGVFFVTSEGAQSFFAESTNSSMMGILAAGALVFAIAPLQRAAERVASAAVPGAKAPGELARSERLDLYREQLRAAWADGNLSADERRLLEVTRERLGIAAEDALRLEREVAPR
jgi:hypothetical protein